MGIWYICILLYVKLLWCSGFPEISTPLRGYVCLWYMCILLYVKLIWCSGFPEIYALLEEGGPSAFGICAFCYMQNLFGVVVFQRSMLDWRRGVHLQWVCLYVYRLYLFGVVGLYKLGVD